MMIIVGISGKIGSGKNYLANLLIEELNSRGYKTGEASFATPLKQELSNIIELIQELRNNNQNSETIIKAITSLYRMPIHHSEKIYSFLEEDINNNSDINGYSRTEGVRRALQYLGTDVRRNVDNNYWVKRFHENLTVDGFVFVTDVRFPNEADSIIEHGGKVLRLEPPVEVVAERTAQRDGMSYSSEAHQHISELALDDYSHFSKIIRETTFDIPAIVDELLK